jgi:methylmalonyl-CoA mutase N-terminal domain/subunit
VDTFGPRLSFFFNAHNNLFEEVAKFRAARRMWAKIMRERFKATNPRAWQLRFHTQTAGSTLTAQQPEVNVIRTTVQALAAVLGGTQSLHTNGKDEALGLPTEESARIALRTQQVLAYESGVADVADPLGGSYLIEALTDELERQATAYIEKIDAMGGMLAAIEQGFPQREIQQAAFEYQRAVERNEVVVVGVNRFQVDEEHPIPIQRIDPEIERAQVERVRSLRARRDTAACMAALDALEAAARGTDNLMPYILDAVERYATVGEISDRLRRVFGEYQETVVF